MPRWDEEGLRLRGVSLAVVCLLLGCSSAAPTEPAPQMAIEPSPVETEPVAAAGASAASSTPRSSADPTAPQAPARSEPDDPPPGAASHPRKGDPTPASTLHNRPPTPPPASPSQAAAKEAFRAGILAFRDGDYAQALVQFERAYAQMPVRRMLHNMALSALRAGRKAKACTYYERGRKQGNPQNRELDQACGARP